MRLVATTLPLKYFPTCFISLKSFARVANFFTALQHEKNDVKRPVKILTLTSRALGLGLGTQFLGLSLESEAFVNITA